MKVSNGKHKTPEVSYSGRIILAAFIFGEVVTLVIEGIYYARGESTLAVFLVDALIFTVLLGLVSLTCYFLFRRVLVRLKDSETRLAAANEELAGYAHTVSHDLKGPITGIALSFGALDTVLKGPLDQDALGKLEEIARVGINNAERAGHLVDDLLFIAEAGRPQEVEPVVVVEKVREVVEEQRRRIGQRSVRLEADEDLGTLVASPTQVFELFDNLVRNSVKYAERDDIVIQVKKLSSNGSLHLLYKDNGVGIDEELLPRVFDRFVKGENGDTGLGLSIVRKIVETYGGVITAYNDNGACFEFELRNLKTD